MEKKTQEKIQTLQLLEQNLQNFLMQKQQFQSQLVEIESALSELGKAKEAYKIVGNIMVSSDKDALEKELKEKQETFEIRIRSIEKQENSIKDRAKKLQEEVLGEMKEK
ncbi:MAG: prefoldin subunit beta [Candidatus Woesearchaeota archaeon]|nr:prefoldin subunit beta [Candidatus Woesearchaeota archaeon]